MTILAWQRAGPQSAPGPARPVLLAHRWASDGGSDWQATGWVGALTAAGHEVLVPDLPGHGESADVLVPDDAEPAGWTSRVIEADLARLGVGAFAAGGWAEGGLVAAHLAARLPDRVARLLLVSCDDHQGLAHAEEVAAGLRDPHARVWNPEAAELVSRGRADRRHHLPTLADWAQRAAWPAAARLGALRTPVLLAVGTDDTHRRSAPRLAGLFHDARLVTEPGDDRSVIASPALHGDVVAFLRGWDGQPPPGSGDGPPPGSGVERP